MPVVVDLSEAILISHETVTLGEDLQLNQMLQLPVSESLPKQGSSPYVVTAGKIHMDYEIDQSHHAAFDP
jgi:hypothetical protein